MSRLASPRTIRRLWIGFGIVLLILVLLDFAYLLFDEDSKQAPRGDGIDTTFGFHAWYGLVSCAVLVLLSKGLEVFLKRREGYYRD